MYERMSLANASIKDESGDCSDENSVIEDIAVMPPHTTYTCDQKEVFGTVSQTSH